MITKKWLKQHTHTVIHSASTAEVPTLYSQQRTGKRIRHSPAAQPGRNCSHGQRRAHVARQPDRSVPVHSLPSPSTPPGECTLSLTPTSVSIHLDPQLVAFPLSTRTPLTPSDDKSFTPAANARTGNAPGSHVVPRSCSLGTFSYSSYSGEPFWRYTAGPRFLWGVGRHSREHSPSV